MSGVGAVGNVSPAWSQETMTAATWPKITAGILEALAHLQPDNIRAQEISPKRFWRENWVSETGHWNSRHRHLDRSLHNLLDDSLPHLPLFLERCKPVQATHYSDSKVLLSQIMAPLRHRLQKRSASLVSHAPRPLQFSHQISGHHFSRFRILNLFCLGPNTGWEDW